MHTKRGFISLVAAIMMSVVIVGFVLMSGQAGMFARFDALGSENKRIAQHISHACVEVALAHIAASTTPSVGQIVIGTNSRGQTLSCTVLSITTQGTVVTVHTTAHFNQSISSDTVSLSVIPRTAIKILSWSVDS